MMVVRRVLLTSFLLSLICLNLVAPTAHAADAKRLAKMSVLEPGAAWMLAQRDPSGGFFDARGDLNPSVTADVLTALVALQNAGVEVDTDITADYLLESLPPLGSAMLGGEGRVLVTLMTAGFDPRDAGGADLVERVAATWDTTTGLYGTDIFSHTFTLMAFGALGEDIDPAAIETIRSTQLDNGSWAYGGDGNGDPSVTAFVIQALIAAGLGDDPMIEQALAYLKSVQAADGGWGYSADMGTDVNTTAFVVMALNAAGENAKSSAWGNAAGRLIEFQNESGAFHYMDGIPEDDLVATLGALAALSGASFPVLPVATT